MSSRVSSSIAAASSAPTGPAGACPLPRALAPPCSRPAVARAARARTRSTAADTRGSAALASSTVQVRTGQASAGRAAVQLGGQVALQGLVDGGHGQRVGEHVAAELEDAVERGDLEGRPGAGDGGGGQLDVAAV